MGFYKYLGLAILVAVWTAPKANSSHFQDDVQENSWDFSGRDAGDCHMNSGTLTIRSNGTGHWSARTWTRHTGNRDIWHSSFTWNDSSNHAVNVGTTAFTLPAVNGSWDSPDMHNDHNVVGVDVDFTYSASLYGQLVNVVPIFNC